MPPEASGLLSGVRARPDVVVRPQFLSAPPSATGTYGDEAADLAVQLGQQVREEERIALRALMPIRENGLPAGLSSAIIAGRRNIKSWANEMAVIHDGWITEQPRIVWSAHLVATSDENFEHLVGLVESFDWLRKRVRQIYMGNGNHQIEFLDKHDGVPRRIEFVARQTKKTGRGQGDINRLILDEWLFGTESMLGALIPAMGAAKDRYVRYASSPGLLGSAALRRLRERGRRGGDQSLSYCEWTTEQLDADGLRVLPRCADPDCTHMAGLVSGCFLDDPEIIQLSNPATPDRLTWEFIAQERAELDPIEFARERAGIWEDPPNEDAEAVFPAWESRVAADPGPPTAGERLALGVDTSADRSTSWIAAAVAMPDDRVRVQIVSTGPGSAWVRGWLGDRLDTLAPVGIAMQRSGPVGTVWEEIRAALPGDVVRGMTTSDMARAYGLLYDAIRDGGVQIVAHPALERAAAAAQSRALAETWLVDRRASRVDVSPLVAVTAALWALANAPEETADDDYDVMASIG